jgi:hypothetical protein
MALPHLLLLLQRAVMRRHLAGLIVTSSMPRGGMVELRQG